MTDARDIVERQNDKPPMHWKPDEKYERFPQTEQEWDWREDPVGKSLERGMARLLFAYCYADPHAPDQMALVLRKDLGSVDRQLTITNARLELRDREIASLRKQLEDARSLPTDDGWEDMVEPVARRLCEKQIRHVRRHDTDKEWLDANMEECVDYSWQDHIQQARTALEVVFGPLPAPPSE